MTLSPSCFDLPKDAEVNEIILGLQNQFAISDNPPHTTTRIFLDTFDWRLFEAQLRLECEIINTTRTFILHHAEQNQILAALQMDKSARFIEDFPQSTLKKRLTSVIEMRALVPVVSLRCELHELNILNTDKKTVVKLRLEKNNILKESGRPGVLLNHSLVLQPVRGYKKQFDTILMFARDHLQLALSDQDIYSQALIKLKIQPGGYTSKPDIQLDPQMRADTATKRILLHLLATLQANEQGTIDDVDSEFLHDFRVACRRTRSALSQIKAVFPNKVVERFKREFAWLQNVTGPTRDLDVYLLNFDEYKSSVPEHFQNALEPLHDFLRRHQGIEQKKLAHTLHTQRYHRLVNSWTQFLQAPVPARSSSANAARPIIDVANERIWKMYKRVVHEGKAINDQSPPEVLHELRKSCKKLRYLMEFFNNLYTRADISLLIKALKQLQNNLGDYNDLHVQIESLEHYGKQMMEQDQPPAETFLAMGTLIEGLDQKQQALRREFESQFQQFNAPQYHTVFKKLFTNTPADSSEQ